MRIGYFAPSYRRPGKSITQKAYPFVKLVVAEGEAEEYIKNGNEVVACPDSVQGNLCRVRNWILNTFLHEYDCVIILDDDISSIGRWEERRREIFEPAELEEACEMHALMCLDAGLKLWGVNLRRTDKSYYREYTPFSYISIVCGPFQAHMSGSTIRYDEKLPLKEDYDISLQHLHKHGGVFRVNYMWYEAKQSQQPGGCATYRNLDREKEQFQLLQKKWGSDVVTMDLKSKKSYDYNPVIKVPLLGV